ncbi:MAG: indolepyruvate oxidoreductase subunit beta [candidate division WOR-3 bacterium]
MPETTNILISGVGGQGVVLASEIISAAAMEAGHDVKQSEVHGMAQRGGSVVSHVRFGPRVFSPLVEPGTGHLLLSFEKSETLRWTGLLNPAEGVIVMNTQEIIPVTVSQGLSDYPHDAVERLREAGFRTIAIDALKLAKEAGTERAVNVVLIGAGSPFLRLDQDLLRKVISERVPPKYRDLNMRAFDLGLEASGG